MMNEKNLTVLNEKEELTIDSREVAEMMGIEHKLILRKLEGNSERKGIITILGENQMAPARYFIESTYKDIQNKERKCYLFTKMGCEFIANKFCGEKGIIFTAKYVQKFNELEKQNNPVNKYLSLSEEDRAILYFKKLKEEKELKAKNKQILAIAQEKDTIINAFIDDNSLYSVSTVAKVLAIKNLGRNNFWKYLRENKIIMSDVYKDYFGKEHSGIKHYEAYSQYCNAQEYFKHRIRNITIKYQNYPQSVAMFTAKGVKWIIKKLEKEGYIVNKSFEEIMQELSELKEVA